MSAAGNASQSDAFWPDHKGEKSLRPLASAAARNGATAAVAKGKLGAWALSGPKSRMNLLTMPRAGRPLNRLVKAVCCADADSRACRCKALVVASWLVRNAVPTWTALAPSVLAALTAAGLEMPPAAMIGNVTAFAN